MTAPPPEALRRPASRDPLRFFGAPGIMARQDYRGQLLFVVTVQLVLLLVAISIDLARYFDQVTSAAGGGLVDRAALLFWYLGLRIVDMVTRLLSIAVFVGILAFELWSILTRRRAIHWISGRHPLRVLWPAAAVGLTLAPLQYELETRWRPEAVITQAAARLGAYGERYDRERPPKPVWFLSGDRLVHADARFGPPAELVDVAIYRLDEMGRVGEVIRAARADPSGTPDVWRIRDATRWIRDPASPSSMTVSDRPEEESLVMPLHPLAVTYMGLPAKYVPDDDLRTIVASGTDMLVEAEHHVWLEVRRANTLMPLAMALLAASVSLFAGARRPSLPVLIGCVLAGYSIHVAIRVFIAAGELKLLAPAEAAWTPIGVALAGVLASVTLAAWRGWRA